MTLPCVLRLTNRGELMHLKFDSESGYVEGIPEEIFRFRIFGKDWSNVRDVNCFDRITYGKLERLVMSVADAVFAVAISNAGYYVQTKNEILYYNTELVKISIVYKNGELGLGRFVEIGYRPTKLICKSVVPYQQRLIYSPLLKSVITEDGVFSVDVDAKQFSINSVKTDKLVALNSGRYFALVNYEGRELWGYTVDDTFKF